MATLTIKNFPDELYRELTLVAKRNRRSLNSEAIVTVERGLDRVTAGSGQNLIERIRDRRERLSERGMVLSADLLRKSKSEGRP